MFVDGVEWVEEEKRKWMPSEGTAKVRGRQLNAQTLCADQPRANTVLTILHLSIFIFFHLRHSRLSINLTRNIAAFIRFTCAAFVFATYNHFNNDANQA
jgi:hypothetical protein